MSMATIINARAMHEAAGNYLAAVTRSAGECSRNAMWAEKKLCEAAIDLWDDGDALTALENLLHDMRSEGMLDSGSEFDAGASHPDSGRGI